MDEITISSPEKILPKTKDVLIFAGRNTEQKNIKRRRRLLHTKEDKIKVTILKLKQNRQQELCHNLRKPSQTQRWWQTISAGYNEMWYTVEP